MNKLPDTWDEVAIGLFIMVVAIAACFTLEKPDTVVAGAVGGLAVYLGGKGKDKSQ